ncbi:MAG: DUF1775 domain-containing protein [Patescibacteria group bacterium]|nr:DUF1775 domain-containing protein [Patescibacteria group bacterium]MDE2589015.1 DUF1775 domain-containing protein [Patescibacteria group bacterium]
MNMRFYRNIFFSIYFGITGIFLLSSPAFAHVIVTPHEAGIASVLDFTVNVPNERNNPVTSVKLLIPKGVTQVSPNIEQGWIITTNTSGSSDATVSEIDWTGGTIPVGQRAEFVFQAQVPPNQTTIAWKAYQTYSDGTIVSWDINPKSLEKLSDSQQDVLADKENKGEYSTTTVINDLKATINTARTESSLPMLFSLVAVALSALTFGVILFRKK